jgi:alginate O-acetyltransferase complex protein AlgI
VFFLCGLWHGAAYTFVVWGLMHGLLLVIERVLHNRFDFVPAGWLGWLLTQLLVMIAWVFFRCNTVSAAFKHLAAMFGGGHAVDQIYSVTFYLTPDKVFFLAAGLLIALFPAERFGVLLHIPRLSPALCLRVGAILCFIYSASLIAANGFNPFIYFRF